MSDSPHCQDLRSASGARSRGPVSRSCSLIPAFRPRRIRSGGPLDPQADLGPLRRQGVRHLRRPRRGPLRVHDQLVAHRTDQAREPDRPRRPRLHLDTGGRRNDRQRGRTTASRSSSRSPGRPAGQTAAMPGPGRQRTHRTTPISSRLRRSAGPRCTTGRSGGSPPPRRLHAAAEGSRRPRPDPRPEEGARTLCRRSSTTPTWR